MKISVQATVVLAAIFAMLAFAVAITGFTSLDGITDPVQLADAKGFAAFWAFLGFMALAIGAGTWWLMSKTLAKDE